MSGRGRFGIGLPGETAPEPRVRPPGGGFAPVSAPAATPVPAPRRGPMAAAIAETAEAARARAGVEAAIRAENDALAEAHVRLKRLGLVAEPVPLGAIAATRLIRDRLPGEDPELDELVASIRAVGLSNPIRLETAGEGRFELVQGARRLAAFRRLHAETADPAWAAIPALVTAPGQSLAESYRRMVDENLVRRDVSFAEMALLAEACAADPATGCDGLDAAVDALFGSASSQKRSYIRAFAELMRFLDKELAHPAAIGRNLGLAVRRQIAEGSPGLADLVQALRARPRRSAEQELSILRGFAGGTLPEEGAPRPPAGRGGAGSRAGLAGAAETGIGAGVARVALTLPDGAGTLGLSARGGRVELRSARDLAALGPERLARAAAAFLAALED
jgi:ParB family transcriptional regulator, chromosome partitioning protein